MDSDPRTAEWDDVPPDEPIVTAQLERALAPYRRLLPPEALATCEEMLEMVLTTHPEIAPEVARLRRATAVQRSEIRPTQASSPPQRAATRAGQRRTGGRR